MSNFKKRNLISNLKDKTKIMITGNEPAMPQVTSNDNNYRLTKVYSTGGMSIRQQFAAMAMQGLFSSMNRNDFPPNLENVEYCAKLGVTAADALINELNKAANENI